MNIQAQIDNLAAEIHEAWEYQYDECRHGTYSGGAMHGEPYSMCEIFATRIIHRRSGKQPNNFWCEFYASMGAAPATNDLYRR